MERRRVKCWICGQVGHFEVNCLARRCWFCRRPGHLKRSCALRNSRKRLGEVQSGPPRCRKRRTPPHENIEGSLLLLAPMTGMTQRWEPRKRKAQVFSSLTQERELPCGAEIGGRAVKALIDTRASITI